MVEELIVLIKSDDIKLSLLQIWQIKRDNCYYFVMHDITQSFFVLLIFRSRT